MARLCFFHYFLWDDVVHEAEVCGPVTARIQIHASPTVHMFSKIRSRGASPEGSGSGDSLETFPVCSSLSRTVCTHCCFSPSSWEVPHERCSDLLALIQTGCRSDRSAARHSGVSVGMKRRRRVSSSRLVSFLSPVGAPPLQPDPECCEALFIKSIPPPWPRGSHANCCLLRPFSTFLFFFLFHARVRPHVHARTHSYK